MAILKASMVYTPDRFTDNSPLSPDPYVNVKNPSARKSIHQIFCSFGCKTKGCCLQVRCCEIKPQGNKISQYVVVQYTKGSRSYKNKLTGNKSLQLYFTSSSGYAVPNSKLSPERVSWRSCCNTIGSKVLLQMYVK